MSAQIIRQMDAPLFIRMAVAPLQNLGLNHVRFVIRMWARITLHDMRGGGSLRWMGGGGVACCRTVAGAACTQAGLDSLFQPCQRMASQEPESHTNVAHHNKPLRELTDDELYAIIAEGESDEEPEADPEKLN